MAIRQISVYARNKKGTLVKTTAALAAAGIDLKSICVADTEDFGIFRLLTSDQDSATRALNNVGFTVSSRLIAAVAIPNVPGELNRVLQILDDEGINIEYMYSIITNRTDMAYMAIRVDDNQRTEDLLKEHGYTVLSDEDL